MRLQTKQRIVELSKHFSPTPAFVLVQMENGEEKEVPVAELLQDALECRFSMHFVKMLHGGRVEDAEKVLDVLDLWLIAVNGHPGAIASERVKNWWESKTDAEKKEWRERFKRSREHSSLDRK